MEVVSNHDILFAKMLRSIAIMVRLIRRFFCIAVFVLCGHLLPGQQSPSKHAVAGDERFSVAGYLPDYRLPSWNAKPNGVTDLRVIQSKLETGIR